MDIWILTHDFVTFQLMFALQKSIQDNGTAFYDQKSPWAALRIDGIAS